MEKITNYFSEVIDYIGDDYIKCPYLYIDLVKYGVDNPNITLWVQRDDSNNISLVVLKYYSGMHIYSKQENFNYNELCLLIKTLNPNMICGMNSIISKISPLIDYSLEIGKVGMLKTLQTFECGIGYNVHRADESDLNDITDVLIKDEALGGTYDYNTLYSQLKERMNDKFGRNFVLQKDRKLVAHCASYAEVEKLSVISGAIVIPEFRGLGLSKITLSAICKELLSEGKNVVSFYYIPEAEKMHKRVGFENIGVWAKLVKH